MKSIEYKHLKEGDILTCEAGGYADFQVGGRYEAKKDDHGLYLTCSGFERPYYLHEMFKHLDAKLDVAYCMCKGAFIFYKELDKEEDKKVDKPYKLTDIHESIPDDFTEDELESLYSGIEELSSQIKLDRNKSKIKVGEVWRYNPIEFEIVGIGEDEEEILAVLVQEDGEGTPFWVSMSDFLGHYSPCNPPDGSNRHFWSQFEK